MLQNEGNEDFDNTIGFDVLIEVFDKQSTKGMQIYKKIISNKDNIAITAITLLETLYGFLKYEKSYPCLLSFLVYEFSK